MASTSSLGAHSKTSASQAQRFYDDFNRVLADMRARIEQASEESELQTIFGDVSRARTALTESTEELPSYDRQTHELHLRQVNDLLAQRWTQLAPKAKFAFKRKAKVAVSPGPTSSAPVGEVVASTTPVSSSSSSSSTYLSIRDKAGQVITASSLPPPDSEGDATDLHILNLQDCLVDLRNLGSRRPFLALQLRNLSRCVVLCGTVDGSTMIHNCSGSLVALACRQFRMHGSHSMAVMISTSSIATIEDCKAVVFGPLDASQRLPNVQDFEHISTLQPSTNWSSMAEAVRKDIEAHLAQPDTTSLLTAAGLNSHT